MPKILTRILTLILIPALLANPSFAWVLENGPSAGTFRSSLFIQQALIGHIASAIFPGKNPQTVHATVHRLFKSFWKEALAEGDVSEHPYQFDVVQPDRSMRMDNMNPTDSGQRGQPGFNADLDRLTMLSEELAIYIVPSFLHNYIQGSLYKQPVVGRPRFVRVQDQSIPISQEDAEYMRFWIKNISRNPTWHQNHSFDSTVLAAISMLSGRQIYHWLERVYFKPGNLILITSDPDEDPEDTLRRSIRYAWLLPSIKESGRALTAGVNIILQDPKLRPLAEKLVHGFPVEGAAYFLGIRMLEPGDRRNAAIATELFEKIKKANHPELPLFLSAVEAIDQSVNAKLNNVWPRIQAQIRERFPDLSEQSVLLSKMMGPGMAQMILDVESGFIGPPLMNIAKPWAASRAQAQQVRWESRRKLVVTRPEGASLQQAGTVDVIHEAYFEEDSPSGHFSLRWEGRFDRYDNLLRPGGWLLFVHKTSQAAKEIFTNWLDKNGYTYQIFTEGIDRFPSDYPLPLQWESPDGDGNYLIVAQKPGWPGKKSFRRLKDKTSNLIRKVFRLFTPNRLRYSSQRNLGKAA